MIKVSFWFDGTYGHSTDISVDSILQEFRDVILSNVNAKECAPELRRQKVIAEGTETDIERARDARKKHVEYFMTTCVRIVPMSRLWCSLEY